MGSLALSFRDCKVRLWELRVFFRVLSRECRNILHIGNILGLLWLTGSKV